MLPAPLARFFIKLIDFKPLKGLTPIPDRAVITTAQHTAKTDGINIILLLYSRYMNRQTNRSQIVFKVKRDETVKGFKKFGWVCMRRVFKLFKLIEISPGDNASAYCTIREAIQEKQSPYVFMSCDGSRYKRQFISSGFYHLAKELNLPICLVHLCYRTKTFGWKVIDTATLTKDEVIRSMREYYADIQPKIPHRASEIQFREIY